MSEKRACFILVTFSISLKSISRPSRWRNILLLLFVVVSVLGDMDRKLVHSS